MRYAIVIEKVRNNLSGDVPALPGCVATGYTEGMQRELLPAIQFHLEGLREDGFGPHVGESSIKYVFVSAQPLVP